MTDPDLSFEFDPQNLVRVERWIEQRWPGAAAAKDADGSRMTWTLAPGAAAACNRLIATETFLSLPPARVEALLEEADEVFVAGLPPTADALLLTMDGPIVIEAAILD
jgi:hypothetical protein